MLSPHPTNIEITDDNLKVKQIWDAWFKESREHVNRGQTPEGTQEVHSDGLTLPSESTNLLVRAVSSTGTNVDITTIQHGFDSQKVTIEGMDNTKTVTLKEGGNIILGGDVVLSNNSVITLHYNAEKKVWIKN